jgi:hypothetical protein
VREERVSIIYTGAVRLHPEAYKNWKDLPSLGLKGQRKGSYKSPESADKL